MVRSLAHKPPVAAPNKRGTAADLGADRESVALRSSSEPPGVPGLKVHRRLCHAEGEMYPARAGNGIATVQSRYSVDDTVARLKELLEARGIRLFALIDHSGEAERSGLRMPNTKLIVFGNPQAGTPLMLAAPTLALDLPLKILVFEESESNVWVAFNTAEYLSNRHNLPAELSNTLAAVSAIANQIAE